MREVRVDLDREIAKVRGKFLPRLVRIEREQGENKDEQKMGGYSRYYVRIKPVAWEFKCNFSRLINCASKSIFHPQCTRE